MSHDSAQLVEIFASIQGEGLYAGQPQVFLRLAGCPLRCRYCDTPEGLAPPDEWCLRLAAQTLRRPNPARSDEVRDALARCDRELGVRRPLSVTGGEPLHQSGFLAGLLPQLCATRPVHLETAGIHADGLRAIAAALAHVSMDWKLDSTLASGRCAERHRAFLAAALALGLETCVKIVLTAEVCGAELAAALEHIRAISSAVPVILQPVSSPAGQVAALPPESLRALLATAERSGLAVRVIPQLHRAAGWR
jgi:organic radical activating enzyme